MRLAPFTKMRICIRSLERFGVSLGQIITVYSKTNAANQQWIIEVLPRQAQVLVGSVVFQNRIVVYIEAMVIKIGNTTIRGPEAPGSGPPKKKVRKEREKSH